jgi:hypothetical protein
LSDRLEHSPEWLVNRIGDEIRHGLRRLHEGPALCGFVIESIRLRLFFKAEWHEILFDSHGCLIATPDEAQKPEA